MKIRKSSVQGKFYPAEKKDIIEQLETITNKERPNIKLNLKQNHMIGGVVPHAGYLFSAYQAVHFFEIVKQSEQEFDTVVIVNPNHTGLGHEIAFDSNDFWETPLGKVPIDIELGKKMELEFSEIEQRQEHSGEVMVPFLQYFLDYDFKIAPITLSNQTYENAKLLAQKIKISASALDRKVLFIASSDFSHFLSPEKGKEKDSMVLEHILALDPESVEKVVRKEHLSVCGFGPIMALMEYSKLLTANPSADVLKIGHSGEIIPSNEVVDYISILFSYA